MKKFTNRALAGALIAAIAATTVLVTIEAASAKKFVPGCEKVKLSGDKTVARQTMALWNRLGPMSGMCGQPK
ncbi:MAG: hypothetical protein J0H94_08445 [Rhizobiales bacterium]|nr:hypothetical protein [Hyphomicrobiales bacterium]